MSTSLISKATEFVRNTVRTVIEFVRRSPWIAAAAAAALVMLFVA